MPAAAACRIAPPDIAELFAVDLPLPRYDVVIPCFDRAHVVADAVASVLAQDHAPSRMIVVDDGSRDASAEVIRALAAAHPGRVTAMILPRNAGAALVRCAVDRVSRQRRRVAVGRRRAAHRRRRGCRYRLRAFLARGG